MAAVRTTMAEARQTTTDKDKPRTTMGSNKVDKIKGTVASNMTNTEETRTMETPSQTTMTTTHSNMVIRTSMIITQITTVPTITMGQIIMDPITTDLIIMEMVGENLYVKLLLNYIIC